MNVPFPRPLFVAALAIGWLAVAPAQSAAHAATAGYLAVPALPDSVDWAPPPPTPGSAGAARDAAAAAAAVALQGSTQGAARFQLAARDADLRNGGLLRAFDCSLGIATSHQTTPHTAKLVERLIDDFGRAPSLIKNRYARPRPFTENGAAICTPAEEAGLRSSGSYPSGHSAAGFGVAMVLAQLLPERASALLARGRSIGDSRVVCNVHWLSDIEEGRLIAAATFARLQAEPRFRRDLKRAGTELRQVQRPAVGCAAERAALGLDRVSR